MVPSVLIPVATIPFNTSGKTDHRTLKNIFLNMSEKTLSVYRGRCGYATKREPTTTTQKLVRDIWAEVLQVDATTIGLDDNFFRMGGDSIFAIQLVSAFRKKGLSLAITEIHQSDDLADMAALVTTSNPPSSLSSPNSDEKIQVFSLVGVQSPSEISVILQNVAAQCHSDPASVQDIYPCSPLQEGIMSLSVRETGMYLCQMVYRLSSTTDLDRFRAAWEDVLAHNEILRTRIVHLPTQGNLQVVLKPHPVWGASSSLQQHLETERSQSFVYGDPLCRYGICKEDTQQSYFVLKIHHVRICRAPNNRL